MRRNDAAASLPKNTFKKTCHSSVFKTKFRRKCPEIFVIVISLLHLSCGATQQCSFNVGRGDGSRRVEVSYNDETFGCLTCSGRKTLYLVSKSQSSNLGACEQPACHGVDCGSKCIPISEVKENRISVQRVCQRGRIHVNPSNDESTSSSASQAPLIIGFAVGGVMLAVVIVGVFLGRANRGPPQSESAEATTPVSMSYSEWISNYSTGGRGSKFSNMRVQESGSLRGADDQGGLSVYSIVYGEDDATSGDALRSSHEGATVIEVDGMFYEEAEQFAYEAPANDVLGYATSAVYDGGDVVRFEWTDDYQEPYEHCTQNDPQSVTDTQISHPRGPVAKNIDYDYEKSMLQVVDDVAMTQLRRPGSWSDESSYYDDVEVGSPLNQTSTCESCLHETRDHANTANLKHVFVDVHRSMTCSCDDLRNSQMVLASISDKQVLRHNDVTKHISFRACQNRYILKDRNQNPSKPHLLLPLLSLSPPSGRTKRRFSV